MNSSYDGGGTPLPVDSVTGWAEAETEEPVGPTTTVVLAVE